MARCMFCDSICFPLPVCTTHQGLLVLVEDAVKKMEINRLLQTLPLPVRIGFYRDLLYFRLKWHPFGNEIELDAANRRVMELETNLANERQLVESVVAQLNTAQRKIEELKAWIGECKTDLGRVCTCADYGPTTLCPTCVVSNEASALLSQ